MAQRDVDVKNGAGGPQQSSAKRHPASGAPATAHGVAQARSLFDRQILRPGS